MQQSGRLSRGLETSSVGLPSIQFEAVPDAKPKSISLTWRFESAPTNRTKQSHSLSARRSHLVGKNCIGFSHVVAARVGICIWNVDPLPTVDSTQIRPPCISTICLAMARPRPVPPFALVFELST